eukprot:Em0666g4a
MRQAGEITYADAHKQRVGEGVVEYASHDDMKNAMKKLDGVELKGRKLRLIEDSKKIKEEELLQVSFEVSVTIKVTSWQQV